MGSLFFATPHGTCVAATQLKSEAQPSVSGITGSTKKDRLLRRSFSTDVYRIRYLSVHVLATVVGPPFVFEVVGIFV